MKASFVETPPAKNSPDPFRQVLACKTPIRNVPLPLACKEIFTVPPLSSPRNNIGSFGLVASTVCITSSVDPSLNLRKINLTSTDPSVIYSAQKERSRYSCAGIPKRQNITGVYFSPKLSTISMALFPRHTAIF